MTTLSDPPGEGLANPPAQQPALASASAYQWTARGDGQPFMRLSSTHPGEGGDVISVRPLGDLQPALALIEELTAALEHLLDACIREFGWQPDAPPEEPCGTDPECEITWGDLHAAHAALSAQGEAAQPAAEGWRDIASAPKDGTRIDLWQPSRQGGNRVTDAFWSVLEDWWCVGDERYGEASMLAISPEPTHWRYPPASPNAASQDGGR